MEKYKLEKVTLKKDFITEFNMLVMKDTKLRINYNPDTIDDRANNVDIWRVSDGLYLGKMDSKYEKEFFVSL